MKYDIDDKSLARWKIVFADDGIEYMTDDECKEAVYNFTSLIDTLIEIDRSQKSSDDEKGTDKPFLLDKDGNKIIL